MSLLLDTSVLIALENQDRAVQKRIGELSRLHPGPPFIPFMSYFEFLWGVKERSPKNRVEAGDFLSENTVLHTTKETANILVGLRDQLEKSGTPLPFADLFIASQAIEHHLGSLTK